MVLRLLAVPRASDVRLCHLPVADVAPIRYRCRLAYDGARFAGMQYQPNAPTVQGALQQALQQRMQQEVKVVAAGRTDTGVHARGQVVHFDLFSSPAANEMEHSLNCLLPPDIRVADLEPAPECDQLLRPWHAIYWATGKLYSYRFYAGRPSRAESLPTPSCPWQNQLVMVRKQPQSRSQCFRIERQMMLSTAGRTMDPMQRLYRDHSHTRPLDFDAMQRAASLLEGTHDFSAFANKKNVNGVRSLGAATVRSVRKVTVHDEGYGNGRADFYLKGALYKMVRNMFGAMLEVGAGRRKADEVEDLLLGTKKAPNWPKPAPAHGLTLESVFYETGWGGAYSNPMLTETVGSEIEWADEDKLEL